VTEGSRRAGLSVDHVTGAAARAGVRAGDRIVAIDGAVPEDVLDLELAASEGRFTLELRRDDAPLSVDVMLGRGEEHGLSLVDLLGAPVRRCANDCTFCFIDQVPAGLRPSLSVKDDDYRLSFLAGTFVTLSNLDRHDLERIAALRLSPLFVSLHAWDDEVRTGLMGRSAGGARERLVWLTERGIATHIQIVLCPGVNDAAVLEETVRALVALATAPCRRAHGHDGKDAGTLPHAAGPGVLDVGVVPVSLAREREGLRRVTAADAAAAIALVEKLQSEAAARLGRRFVHAADELYLAIGRMPPPGDAPEQYENGVGICAAFLNDVAVAALPGDTSVALLGGRAAAPVLDTACRVIAARTGAVARPFVVDNALFGTHVTVTGLLGGREVVAALRKQPLAEGEWLLAPRSFLPDALGRTLDDVSADEIAEACGGRLALGHDLAAAAAAVGSDARP
jgi:putative radical SAM enzyme (TIGR03279 family)